MSSAVAAATTGARGKIFYFRPGHETHPVYYHPDVLKVITNAGPLGGASGRASAHVCNVPQSIEKIG